MNDKYMKIALEEARKSYDIDEVPVGCVIVHNGRVIAKAHNKKENKKCVLFHAELLAIYEASKKMNNWRLNDCELYVTVEPCPMCSSAIKQARISKVYYGITNKNNGQSKLIFEQTDINNKVQSIGKIMEEDCKNLIRNFFEKKRKKEQI